MRILRQIPPAAPSIRYRNLLYGLAGLFDGDRYVAALERDLRDFFGVPHVFLLGSGKAALLVVLRALSRLAPGKDEVLIPAYTCFSVPSAIVGAGLEVGVCDIEKSTFGFSQERLEQAIHERTLCVVPTHLFGIPADIDRTLEICRRKGVFCVEDAAQAMGGNAGGRLLGTIGDVGVFSLGRGKNITCGGGGIILTRSDAIASEIAREYGSIKCPAALPTLFEYIKICIMFLLINRRFYWLPSLMPFLRLGETVYCSSFPLEKLSGVKAALLNGWVRQLGESNSIRLNNTEYYRTRLIPGPTPRLPAPCLRFPVLVENQGRREALLRSAATRGLGLSRMYPKPVNEIDEIRGRFDGASFPSAKDVAERLITLPTHSLVTEKDREEICRAVGLARTHD